MLKEFAWTVIVLIPIACISISPSHILLAIFAYWRKKKKGGEGKKSYEIKWYAIKLQQIPLCGASCSVMLANKESATTELL